MSQKLTRKGARSYTKMLDRVASVAQKQAEILGLPPEVALDFARRADVISDQVELTAAANFPLVAGDDAPDEKDEKDKGKTAAAEWAQAPKNETGLSLPVANGGWDANTIGDDRGGPYLSQSDESGYMAGRFAQNWFNELRNKVESNSVPRLGQVDKFAAAGMAMSACLRDVIRVAQCGKMADSEYRDGIQQLAELDRLVAETQAEIAMVSGDLQRKSAQLTGDQKKVIKGFDSLIDTLKGQSGSIIEIRAILLDCTKLVSASPGGSPEAQAADAQFSADVREATADLWDAIQKEAAGFQRAVAKLQYSAGIMDFLHSVEEFSTVVWGALERLFEMATSAITGAKERVAKSFANLKSAYGGTATPKAAADDRNLLRRLLAEEGMDTRLAGDAEDEDEPKDEDDEEEEDDDANGKTAGFNLFE